MKYKIIKKELEINNYKKVVDYKQVIIAKCKTCNKNDRRNGSAFCIECAEIYNNK